MKIARLTIFYNKIYIIIKDMGYSQMDEQKLTLIALKVCHVS